MKTGIVVRQTFFSSISAYIGILIGYFNSIILMPKYLLAEEIGLMRTVLAISMLLVPIVLAGTTSGLVKYYPRLENKIPSLNAFSLMMILVSFSLVTIVSYFFQTEWFLLFAEKSPAINQHFWLVYGLLFMMVIFNFLEAISRTQLDIITPNMFRELVYKSAHMGVVLLVGFGLINFQQYLNSQIIIYVGLIGGLTYFIWRKVPIRFQFKNVFRLDFGKEVFRFSMFSVMGNFGIMMVLQIDQIMVSSFLGLEMGGIYFTAVLMAVVIELPRRLVSQITMPMVSKAYMEQRLDDINAQYKSVSINLLLLGGLLLLLITLNIDNIFAIMPNGNTYQAGMWVVYLIGTTKVIDMLFSINGEIISMSNYYRVNVFLILGLGIATAITNYIFIPIYGINGAALATLVTYIIFNIVKYFMLKKIYNFDPFTTKTLLIILSMLAGYFAIDQIPVLFNAYIDLILRSLVVVGYFVALIWIVKPSDELISLLKKFSNNKNPL